MALEKRWSKVDPIPTTSDGTVEGEITLSSIENLFVKQEVVLKPLGSSSGAAFQIKRIEHPNKVYLGGLKANITDRSDLTAFLAGSTLQAQEQPRPNIGPDDIVKAVYSEEPITALKTVTVGSAGERVDFNQLNQNLINAVLEGSYEVVTAGEDFNPLELVYLSAAGEVSLADQSTLNTSEVIGITLHEASVGDKVQIITQGFLRDSTFLFTPNLTLFLGSDGEITTTNPTDHYVVIGKTLGDNRILVRIEEPIIL